MGTERDHYLDDGVGREQAPPCLAGRAVQSGALAGLDSSRASVGLAADEHCAMDYIHKEPHEMDEQEKRELEAAIWRACWTLMITFDEAKAAVAKYCQ